MKFKYHKYNKFYLYFWILYNICYSWSKKIEKQKNEPINQNKNFDEEEFLNYKGGELEPKWEWAKNISVVYTWVDGEDPNFIDVKSKYQYGIRNINSRYRSADELRYSLRSLSKYLPWHKGNIFIVTYHQVPDWLDLRNERIRLIDHEDIIPKGIYPTFDSNTIELFLDRIPGLSERFLYLNDDFFLNHYVHPSFFFTSEAPFFYPKVFKNKNVMQLKKKNINHYIKKNINSFYTSCYFTRQLILERLNPNFKYHYLEHCVFVLYRDLYEPFRQLFWRDLKPRLAYRFRHYDKLQILYLYQYFMKSIKLDQDMKEKDDDDNVHSVYNNIPSIHKLNNKDEEYFLVNENELTKNVTLLSIRLINKGKLKKNNFSWIYPMPKNRLITHYSAVEIPGTIGEKYLLYGVVRDGSEKNQRLFKTVFLRKDNLFIYNINDEYSKTSALYELTEFLIRRYEEPSPFEKLEAIDLELLFRNKLKNVNNFIHYNMTEWISLPNLFSSYRQDQCYDIRKKKDAIFKNYFEDKKKLNLRTKNGILLKNKYFKAMNDVKKNKLNDDISDREKEEIQFLLNYHGESLTKDWEWAKTLSLVYILGEERKKIKQNQGALNENLKKLDFLKFSLRSVEKYLPWFEGTIYIVYDRDEINIVKDLSWLSPFNSKIKFIEYEEIIPKDKKIAKRKHVVEMYLDCIPDISERFIILEPNHFFLNPTHPRFFFTLEHYPKYNFKPVLASNNEPLRINSMDSSVFYTYTLIKKYFGKRYVRVRELMKAPIPSYRDLFNPVRQLYLNELNNLELNESLANENIFLLPIYLVSTYNIYGTEQPFFPDYVLGFGKVTHSELPTLPKNRTISYYGFGLTSSIIIDFTTQFIKLDSVHNNDPYFFNKTLENIKTTFKLFLSITFDDLYLEKTIKNKYFKICNSIFDEKLFFEN